MSSRDTFHLYLRNLPARDISLEVLGDGRHLLDITRDVQLYVRPDEDDLDAVIAGLRKLAATAGEMAEALTAWLNGGADPALAGKLAALARAGGAR